MGIILFLLFAILALNFQACLTIGNARIGICKI